MSRTVSLTVPSPLLVLSGPLLRPSPPPPGLHYTYVATLTLIRIPQSLRLMHLRPPRVRPSGAFLLPVIIVSALRSGGCTHPSPPPFTLHPLLCKRAGHVFDLIFHGALVLPRTFHSHSPSILFRGLSQPNTSSSDANTMEGYYHGSMRPVGEGALPHPGSQSLPSRKRVRTDSRPTDLHKSRRMSSIHDGTHSSPSQRGMPSRSQNIDIIDLTGYVFTSLHPRSSHICLIYA